MVVKILSSESLQDEVALPSGTALGFLAHSR